MQKEKIKYFCASNDRYQLKDNIINNPYIQDITIELDSNRGKGLPERYNEFIDRNLDFDGWLCFIHDDVELMESPKVDGLPKNIIYGACGAKKINGKGAIIGQIWAQDTRINDGVKFQFGKKAISLKQKLSSEAKITNEISEKIEYSNLEIVPTFDPLFILMHTDLLKISNGRWRVSDFQLQEKPEKTIRFDKYLGYHLFSEELSIRAKKNYNIDSAVLQVNLCHYSWGTKTPEYFEALEYIKKKHGLQCFIGTCEHTCMDDSERDDWE